MRALRLEARDGGVARDFSSIVVADVADPGAPGPGAIRVAVEANAINYHDLLVANGGIPTENHRILLSDGAGVVEAVGAGVTEFAVGDRVVSTFFPVWESGGPDRNVGHFHFVPGDGTDGLAAEHVVRPARAFTKAPAGWSAGEAATITTAGLTAWRALVTDGGLKAGEWVLVEGTGGVSVMATQIAKACGARVIATSSSDEKLAKIGALGADFGINYRAEPDWGKKARALTGGTGVDHVVEVGGPATLRQALKAVRVGGHIAQIGILSGLKVELPIMELVARQARLQGLLVASRADQQAFVRALEATGIRPVIDRVFAAGELADAFRHMEAGRHFGKIGICW